MSDIRQIELGPGTLTVKLMGETEPVQVGYANGATFKVATKEEEITSEEFNGPLDTVIVNKTVTLEIELAEANLREMVLCAGEDPTDIAVVTGPPAQHTIAGGGQDLRPFGEFVYTKERRGESGKNETLTIYKGKLVGGTAWTYDKKQRVYKGTIKGHIITDSTDANYGKQYTIALDDFTT